MARLFTILGFVCAFAGTTSAATFTVTTTADSGAGSLRQAILDANANGSAVTDTIDFNIPGAGVQTIQPVTALPSIATPVLIDGYTQPGASANTLPFAGGTNAVIRIALDGVFGGFNGLVVAASGSTVRGLAIHRFSTGILLGNGVTIVGNFIGTDATGTVDMGNAFGIFVENGNDNDIGTVAPASRNVISGNDAAIVLGFSEENTISGNYIGTAADGATALGNLNGILLQAASNNVVADNLISGNDAGGASAAIELSGSSSNNIIASNFIGTTATGGGSVPNRLGINFTGFIMGGPTDNIIGLPNEGNTFANNIQDAIVDNMSEADRNRIQYNAFRNNGGLGIDLSDDGPTPNDPLDEDGGPNQIQNYPVITSATRSTGGAAIISGTLHSLPSTTFTVQLHYTVACDPSGFGEGAYIAETTVNTDAAGNAAFTVSLPSLPPGGQITGTAIDPAGNTSEFSACAPLVSEDPQITIDDPSVTEGDAGTTMLTFTVTLSPASLFPVTVTAQTADDTAIAPSDYLAASQLLTFAPGETTRTFTVTVNGDTAVEADETLTVVLSGPTNAAIADNSGTGSIFNDDVVTPTSVDLSIAKTGPATVMPGGTIAYTITVENDGGDPATNVVVTDVLPASVTFVSATPSQGTCSGTTTITCTLGTLAASATATIALNVTAPATPQAVANTATVTATETDPDATDNADTATTTVSAAADIAAVPMLDHLGLAIVGLLLAVVALRRL